MGGTYPREDLSMDTHSGKGAGGLWEPKVTIPLLLSGGDDSVRKDLTRWVLKVE